MKVRELGGRFSASVQMLSPSLRPRYPEQPSPNPRVQASAFPRMCVRETPTEGRRPRSPDFEPGRRLNASAPAGLLQYQP